MIRHFVLLKFQPETSLETKQSLFADLAGLQKHLPGIIGFKAAENIAVETDLIRGNHDVFWFDFEDEKARDIYLEDPAHQAVGARIVAELDGGIEGVTVIDMAL
ncbi:MAG: Dabb family protein [Cohaesibacter sp.]|nr:Dabb family protein [Cohaesibacter sp.]